MSENFVEFADFVEQFQRDLIVYDEEPGSYNNEGKWIEGAKTSRTIPGIILPASSNSKSSDEMRFVNDGGLIEKKRKIYTVEKLVKGQQVDYDGQSYKIKGENSYSAYADVFIYYAEGVNT